MDKIQAFLKRDIFQLNGFHVTVGVVVLIAVVFVVWKMAHKR